MCLVPGTSLQGVSSDCCVCSQRAGESRRKQPSAPLAAHTATEPGTRIRSLGLPPQALPQAHRPQLLEESGSIFQLPMGQPDAYGAAGSTESQAVVSLPRCPPPLALPWTQLATASLPETRFKPTGLPNIHLLHLLATFQTKTLRVSSSDCSEVPKQSLSGGASAPTHTRRGVAPCPEPASPPTPAGPGAASAAVRRGGTDRRTSQPPCRLALSTGQQPRRPTHHWGTAHRPPTRHLLPRWVLVGPKGQSRENT